MEGKIREVLKEKKENKKKNKKKGKGGEKKDKDNIFIIIILGGRPTF